MPVSRSARRSAALFPAAFFLCGIGHVLLYGVDFCRGFSQLFCGALLLIWALTVQRRVTDRRLKYLLLWVATLLLFFFYLQIARYSLVPADTREGRWIWYAYYLPMMGSALLCFYVALCIHRPLSEKLSPVWFVPGALGALIVAGILTNDWHMLAFRLGENWETEYTYGPLYYVFFFYVAALLLAAFLIILWKCRRSPIRKYRLLPLLPILLLAVYLLMNEFRILPRPRGGLIWNIGEVFGFGVTGFLEICIQIGLIPANKEYDSLFRLADLPAVILDSSGEVMIRTAGTQYPFPVDGDRRIMTHPIPGGSIQWAVDMTHIRELNEELREATRQMEARNAYLAAENQIREEKAELEIRSRLYDRITTLLRPQLESIEERIRREEGVEERLPGIAVLCAYIKRRSNMELLAADGDLPLEELALAVRETVEYVRLCGINAAVSAVGTGRYSPGIVTAAYEALESVIEEALDALSYLMIAIRAEEDRLTVRLFSRAEELSEKVLRRVKDRLGESGSVSFSREGQDLIIGLAFPAGRRESA